MLERASGTHKNSVQREVEPICLHVLCSVLAFSSLLYHILLAALHPFGFIPFCVFRAAESMVIKMAISEKEEIGEQSIVIILTEALSTQQAAKIFLNINTEQKPVPQSLVYDLFGEVKESDSCLVRANDIAKQLHDDKESPYYQCIKLPGSSQGVGKVDLSTVVNALKTYIIHGGVFEQYNISDYEIQYRIILNFFSAIKYFYVQEGCWLKNSNPFMSNAGFFAGTKFLCEDLIIKCAEKRSFETSTIIKLLELDENGLLFRDDIKNKQGNEQRNIIYNFLKNALLREMPNQDEYKF